MQKPYYTNSVLNIRTRETNFPFTRYNISYIENHLRSTNEKKIFKKELKIQNFNFSIFIFKLNYQSYRKCK